MFKRTGSRLEMSDSIWEEAYALACRTYLESEPFLSDDETPGSAAEMAPDPMATALGPVHTDPMATALGPVHTDPMATALGPVHTDPMATALGAVHTDPMATALGPVNAGPMATAVGPDDFDPMATTFWPDDFDPMATAVEPLDFDTLATAVGPIDFDALATTIGPFDFDPTAFDTGSIDPVAFGPTAADPTTFDPVAPDTMAVDSLAPGPVTVGPFAPGPVTVGPFAPGPVTVGPFAPGPVTVGPVTPESVTVDPVAAEPMTFDPALFIDIDRMKKHYDNLLTCSDTIQCLTNLIDQREATMKKNLADLWKDHPDMRRRGLRGGSARKQRRQGTPATPDVLDAEYHQRRKEVETIDYDARQQLTGFRALRDNLKEASATMKEQETKYNPMAKWSQTARPEDFSPWAYGGEFDPQVFERDVEQTSGVTEMLRVLSSKLVQ